MEALSGFGHSREDVEDALNYLGDKGVVLRESANYDPGCLCCLSSVGYAMYEIHNQYHYIGRCAEDSFIADRELAARLSERLKNFESEGRLLESAIDFCRHLSICKNLAEALVTAPVPDNMQLPDFDLIEQQARVQLNRLRRRNWIKSRR